MELLRQNLYTNFLTYILLIIILLIGIIKKAQQACSKKAAVLWWCVFGAAMTVTFFLCSILPNLPTGTDYYIDYGLIGVMLPVIVYVYNGKVAKIIATALMLVLLGMYIGDVQWFGLLAVPLIAIYNGERGKLKLKYLFYVYYPIHMVAIYGISLLM